MGNSLIPNPYLNYCLVPINDDGSINVKFVSDNELDVNIVGIDTDDELDINIDEIGGSYVSSGGSIDVNIDEVGGSYVSSGGPISVEIE